MTEVHDEKTLSLYPTIRAKEANVRTLEMDLARRGVYPDARTRAKLRYEAPRDVIVVHQCRFVWCQRNQSIEEMLLVRRARICPLWVFIQAIPERLDVVGQNLLDKTFGKQAAFVFSGSDGSLCIWRQTLAGNRIEPYTHPSKIESNVWLAALVAP